MEPGVGGSSAPPTQWDRGNRQVPSGKSHRAGRILTTNDIFGLRRRAVDSIFPTRIGVKPDAKGAVDLARVPAVIRRLKEQD